MNFPDKYLVYDIRSSKDLKNSTISGYKKMDVINAFQNSMINNNIQESIKWCVELHISCYDKDIWKSFFNVYFKNIHFKNPKLFIYILKRKKLFDNIIQFYPKNHSLFSRNNLEIRNLYAELTCFINNCPKSNLFLQKSLPSINLNKINNGELKKRMISKNTLEIEQFIFSDTNNTVKLCLNEIYNHLKPDSNNININNIFFWYLYLEKNKATKAKNSDLDFNKKNVSVMDFFKKEENKQKNENEINIYDTHWTFMLWNIINYFKNKIEKNNILLIEKLELYYKDNFKLTQINSKKYIFLYCFFIIKNKNKINWNTPLIYQEHIYIQSNANINNMYLNILKNIYSTLNNEQQSLYFKKYYKTIQSYTNKNNENKNEEDNATLNKIDMNENLNIILSESHNFLINKSIGNNNSNNSGNNSNNSNNSGNNSNNSNNPIKVNNNLINKNKTMKDVIDEKDKKIIKKLDLFVNCFIQKKQKTKLNVFDYYKNVENNNHDECIKNIDIKKK